MKAEPETKALIEMLYERIPELFDKPKREWVGLTDEDISSVLSNLQVMYNRPPTTDSRAVFARAIEAKLKEKNSP